jgi:hypothetical protein
MVRRRPIQPDVRATGHRRRDGTAARDDLVFRYKLVDLAGREVDVVERHAPLRPDETVMVGANEGWRIVAILGTSATVARTS